jgi:hypothetical protein
MSDAFSLLDKVLLHEMTHGRSAYNIKDVKKVYIQTGLIDVPVLKGIITWPIISKYLDWPSYGWKLARQLTTTGEPTGDVSKYTPDNNSDTLALFGSGMPRLSLRSRRKGLLANASQCAN